MITQRKSIAALVVLCITVPLKVACITREASPDSFVATLVQIEQQIKDLEQQQQDLAEQKRSMQQRLAKQQEQLLYKEQEHKEWRTNQKEKLAQADAVIKKLEQEHDFAESQRLKMQKKEQEDQYTAQKTPKKDELEKQRAQLEQDRQEGDRLLQHYEKITQSLASKKKEQREIVEAFGAKMNALHANNDLTTLRKAKATLKTKIEHLKSSSLKEVSAFIDLLQVPLQDIRKRISYLEKTMAAKYQKQIAQIKKDIDVSSRPEELDNVQLAVNNLKKNIISQPLSKSSKNSLLNQIERELEERLSRKKIAAEPPHDEQVTVSHTGEQQEEPAQAEPESDAHEQEVEEVAKDTQQTKKEENTLPKTENKTVVGFVLNKNGTNFEKKEYQNVIVTMGPQGVTHIAHNNQTIHIVPVPPAAEYTHDNSPEWIAAEIYLQQLGNNKKRIEQLLKQSKMHYEKQASYDVANSNYNEKLFNYLRRGLIPLLEAKAAK